MALTIVKLTVFVIYDVYVRFVEIYIYIHCKFKRVVLTPSKE